MRDVGIGEDVPMRIDVVLEFYESAILLESHVRTMVVGAAVLCACRESELALAHTIACLALKCSIRPCPEIYVGTAAINIHVARYDVHRRQLHLVFLKQLFTVNSSISNP